MGSTPPKHLTYAEYLSLDTSSEDKHEYLRGEVWAVAGGTPEHGRIPANLIREIGNALGRRPCVAFSSDVRVRIEASDRTTYPDLSVVCGKREVSKLDPHAIGLDVELSFVVRSYPFAQWWQTHGLGVAPLGYLLREAHPERWLRIHSLPESKRYPDTDEDWEELLGRQRELASHVLGEGEAVWLVAAEHELDERTCVPEVADVELVEALELRVDPDVTDDSSIWAFHVASVRWDAERFEPLLRAIALDARRALFVRQADVRVLAPYDGGVDLILESRESRDRMRDRYRAWLSKHSCGL